MGARLYVGNLSYETQADGLRQLVEGAGHAVADVHVVTDRETGRSRGFAFVELKESGDLPAVLESLDGQSLDGRRLAFSEARPRQPREGGGSGDRRSGPGPRGPRSFDRGGPSRPAGRPGDRPPDTEHRRPRDGSAGGYRSDARPGGAGGGFEDRKPRRDPGFGGPPPGFGGPPPLETSGKEEGRRRNKKWDKGRTEDKKDDTKRRSGGGPDRGRKRRGGGRKGGWDNGDDW